MGKMGEFQIFPFLPRYEATSARSINSQAAWWLLRRESCWPTGWFRLFLHSPSIPGERGDVTLIMSGNERKINQGRWREE